MWSPMLTSYVLIIEPANQSAANEKGYIASCETLGFFTQGENIPEIVRGFLETIPAILELDQELALSDYNQTRAKTKEREISYDIHIRFPKHAQLLV